MHAVHLSSKTLFIRPNRLLCEERPKTEVKELFGGRYVVYFRISSHDDTRHKGMLYLANLFNLLLLSRKIAQHLENCKANHHLFFCQSQNSWTHFYYHTYMKTTSLHQICQHVFDGLNYTREPFSHHSCYTSANDGGNRLKSK